jgi:hypothetical protein
MLKRPSLKLRTCVLAFSLLALASLSATAKDIPAGAWAGTWSASSASKFPGTPPQVDQVTIQPDGTVAVHVVNSEGKTTDWSYKPQAGNFVPIQGRDNVKVKIVKVNDQRMDQIWDSKGKISKSHSTLSKDGKTQTFYAAPGKDKDGKPFQEVVVYEKQ